MQYIKYIKIALSKLLRALFVWQGQKDLNPQPTVLETATLPIELYPYGAENEIRTRDPRLGKAMLYR